MERNFATDRQDNRRKDFKSGASADDARRKREEQQLRLRKESRDTSLISKRRAFQDSAAQVDETSTIDRSYDMGEHPQSVQSKIKDIGKYAAGVYSEDPALQYENTANFRKLLSIESIPPITAVIDSGVVPRLVSFLTRNENPKLQFEAAWALTNISSGTSAQTAKVVQHGAVPLLVQLLRSPADEVREQSIWCLGNIAGDSTMFRDMILECGGMDALLSTFNDCISKLGMLRNATWTLSNLCRGKPAPPLAIVEPALGRLRLLINTVDDDVLVDACWALSYISDGDGARIQAVLNANVCHRLVELMMHHNNYVKVPALRTIGNIVTGSDLQTSAVINVNALPMLWQLLRSNKKTLTKEAAWTVSNITAGSREQIQEVIDVGLIDVLVDLTISGDNDIKRETVWAISNATTGGSPEQIRTMVEKRCIEAICSTLTCQDVRINIVALDGLKNILAIGENDARMTGSGNKYALRIEECGGLRHLENLQMHNAHDIYLKAYTILLNYFNSNPEPQAAPTDNRGAFSFGNQTSTPPSNFNFSN